MVVEGSIPWPERGESVRQGRGAESTLVLLPSIPTATLGHAATDVSASVQSELSTITSGVKYR